ncbi:hypothetical protein LINPERHAP1_LOCUS29179 [Linum perenne]
MILMFIFPIPPKF